MTDVHNECAPFLPYRTTAIAVPSRKGRVSRVALYYTRRPKPFSVIFHMNFLAVCTAAYFWNFLYGKILSKRTNSRSETAIRSFIELVNFRNLLFLLDEFVFLSSTQTLVHDLTYFHMSDLCQIRHTASL